jgi:D-lactate dehydrogenase (cytochrome)
MNPKIVEAFAKIVGDEHVSSTNADREQHSRDQSSHAACIPDAVIWPAGTQQVSAILRYANDEGVPVVGWGAGSSLEGNPIPVKGGIVVDFGRMNRMLDVHEEDFQVTVQPGILYKDMNQTLAKYGLFFAPDPGANASIGGMIANNAAGIRTVRYGATRDNVLALEVVLASGQVIRTGSRSIKQSAGYDLTHLIIGSEGTLGLVTEATLKLAPVPEFLSALTVSFPSTQAAAEAVYAIIGSGLNPAALELLDTATVEVMNAADGLGLPATPGLFLEFHGTSDTALESELELVKAICQASQSQSFEAGIGREARDRIWHSRHHLGEVLIRLYPGQSYLVIDVSVPISNYPAMVDYSAQALDQLGMPGFIFGHAGDGNMHAMVFYALEDEATNEQALRYNDRVVNKAIEQEGTSTGEHGVGLGKQKYMVREHGEAAVSVMRQLKATLDPNGILNPGKILG